MPKPWFRFSTSRYFNANTQRDEIREIHFGRGTNSYQDGPAEDFRLSRGLMSEADFLELALLIETGAALLDDLKTGAAIAKAEA